MSNARPRIVLGVAAAGVVIAGSAVAVTWGGDGSTAATGAPASTPAVAPSTTAATPPPTTAATPPTGSTAAPLAPTTIASHAATPTHPPARPPATSGTKTTTASAKKATRSTSKAAAKPLTYVVKPGDNLTVIAQWFHVHGYQPLYSWNKTVIGKNPNLIFAGQRITVAPGGEMTVG